jgi:glycerol-3-phosphate dehydrogenase
LKNLKTEILVIGGGATGTGILRDLAMRGFKTILVEKRDLAHGTTGRYHGLLHSGGRYVLKDPQAAKECILENRILRRIMPFCIEDTGGFFVTTPWDDPDYANQFITGCKAANIPVEEVSISHMLEEEPLLNPNITRCLRVPDASADSFLGVEANVASARQYGAQSLTYHEVRHLVCANNRVTGAVCYDLAADEDVAFEADMVVNASGAWAGKIAATIGVEVQIKPGKGTMVAVNHRILNTVVNRCKMPSDGDIIVPAHTVAVIGTTDEQVADPDHFGIEPWEIQLMLEEGEKLVPGFRRMRMLRAWAGVRPLYQETVSSQVSHSRDITRAFVLLDHAERDGMDGLLTITSGKWTTYRMMAAAAGDKVCDKLKVNRPCRTHLEEMASPSEEHASEHHWLGARLAQIEKKQQYGNLICECELATEEEIIHAIHHGEAKTIDDIRRDTRLGKGPCQGGFCTLRVAGLLHQERTPPAETVNASLHDFLQERWKGVFPVLWGQQLRQERLDELIYLDILNIDHLPGPKHTRMGPDQYSPPDPSLPALTTVGNLPQSLSSTAPVPATILDALVVGAGLAGLVATWRLSQAGKKVYCISKGWGAQHWSSGCIDVLGYLPFSPENPVLQLRDGLRALLSHSPQHPYAICGESGLAESLAAFQNLCAQHGYPLLATGDTDVLSENWMLPTAIGSLRPTCLAPVTMIAGDCRPVQDSRPMLIIGFKAFLDFFPHLAAANLAIQGVNAQAISLDLPALQARKFVTGRTLAQLMEQAEFRSQLCEAILAQLNALGIDHEKTRFGFPAVLGMKPDLHILQDLQERLGNPVFEMPGLPPSIPGIRLHQLLIREIELQGGQVADGMLISGREIDGQRVINLSSEAAARQKVHYAREYVLATGGVLGGGTFLEPPSKDRPIQLTETVFNIPVQTSPNPQLIHPDFIHPAGHPLFTSGLVVNRNFRPIDHTGRILLLNGSVVGGAIAGADPLRERSLEGIALATAYVSAGYLSNIGSA